MTPGPRGPRGPRGFGFLRARSQSLVYFACFAAIGYSYMANRENIDRIEAEGVERRDQSCDISEAKHKADVVQLERTYAYLLSLSPREKRSSINRAVLANLPNVEREARLDPAPSFCDEPGVGLKEPDPKIPARPPNL